MLRPRQRRVGERIDRLGEPGAAADRLDRDGLDDELLALVDEAEARLVGGLERGLYVRQRDGLACPAVYREARHHQRRVGAGITDVRAHMHAHGVAGHALADHLVAGLAAEALSRRDDGSERALAERLLDRLLARRANVGEPHAVGGQQRRERMDQHLGHAERVGDQAGVLAAGAAEAVERIARHVVAALHRDLLDRVRHVLDRDPDEAVGDVLGRAVRRRSRSRAA